MPASIRWMGQAMNEDQSVRLPPLPREQWGDSVRAALEAGFPEVVPRFFSNGPDHKRLPNSLGTMLYHPALAEGWLAFSKVLLREPVLGTRQREIVVLRLSWRARSNYEWIQHTRMAVKLGLTKEEVIALARDDVDLTTWAPLEQAMIRATDELLDEHRIADGTWADLAEHLDEAQLVELVFTVGNYACLAWFFNSAGMEPDPDFEPLEGVPLPA